METGGVKGAAGRCEGMRGGVLGQPVVLRVRVPKCSVPLVGPDLPEGLEPELS